MLDIFYTVGYVRNAMKWTQVCYNLAYSRFEIVKQLLLHETHDQRMKNQVLERAVLYNSPIADPARRQFLQWLVYEHGAALRSSSLLADLVDALQQPKLWTKGYSVPVLLGIDAYVHCRL